MKNLVLGLFVSISTITAALPAKAEAEDKENQIKGSLQVSYVDYKEQGRSELLHKLVKKDGTVVPFKLNGNSISLQHGKSVSLPASVLKNPNLPPEQVTLFEGGDNTQQITTSTSTASADGNRSVLVMLVKFENTLGDYATIEQANDLVFKQANEFYLESSKGKVGLTGDTIGYLTVPLDKYNCDTRLIATEADNLARQQGFEPTNYDHIMYVIEAGLGCGWSGEATVGGSSGLSWIKDFRVKTIVHELGHNLGLHHSKSKDCGENTNSDSCSVIGYGDKFDAMGGGDDAAHYNAFQKERLGWLDNQITTVTNDQVITLDFYESSDTFGNKAAKVYLGNDSQGYARYYYLEYRTPIGFDNSLFDSYPQLADSILLREGTENTSSSFLLDSTPMSATDDWIDSMIVSGQQYHDQDTGVSIELISADGYQATVGVSFNNPISCTSKAPSFIASSTIEVPAWERKTLSYSLKSNDSTDCPTSNISLSSVLPAGWVGQWHQDSISLSPQQTATVYFDLTVDGNIGSTQINLQANSGNNAVIEELIQTVNVTDTSSNSAPVAISDTLTLNSKTSGTIAVLSNDSDADGDALHIVSVSDGAKGHVIINSDNTITYTPYKQFKSSDNFSYTISDGTLSSTTNVNVKLVSNSGSGGNKGGGKGPK